MARRTPPSHEALTEALRRHTPTDRLIPVADARRLVAREFATNIATARRWIESARAARAVYWVRTSDLGGVSVLVPRTDGKPGEWWATLPMAGFGDRDLDVRFRADRNGAWTDKGPRREVPEAIWLATPETLEYFARRAQESASAADVEHAAERVLTDATLQHMHGDAVDMIRGLLDAAGLHLRPCDDWERGMTILDSHVHREDRSVVTVTLYGEDIDRLADALRQLRIRPVSAEE